MATILFTQIVNNKKTVLHLCKECAQKRGLQTSQKNPLEPINDFLAGMVEEGEEQSEVTDALQCATCGLTYKEFRASGKLGCSQCYPTFDKPLKKLLRKIHGNTIHHGKLPARKSESRQSHRQLEDLKKELAEAIKQEEFEKAADLRDQIKAFKKRNRS
jgi:protein arginine kinase activator